jgi:DNA helicase II / ATP-dependent DNA helicase PcrA
MVNAEGLELSVKQQEIVTATGNVVVNACPGSGKTFSVAARIAHLLKTKDFHHQGIAAISFTNTAWQEIEKKLKEDFQIDVPIHYPHFLGTIDSFLNKYVFLPYGHLRIGKNERPQLVGEPHSSWSGKGYFDGFFDKISFDKSGHPYIFSGTIIKKEQQEKVFEIKNKIIKAGFANQADANYISRRVFQNYPIIARNIATRFPYLIIDEAQDTTDVQMEIINILHQHTNEIMLIGDPDQAIFEWNHAKPDLFHKKIIEWAPPIELDENRRSSQNICNCANAFLGQKKSIPLKGGEVIDYNFLPELKEFDPLNPKSIDQIKVDFLALCKDREIEEEKIAIIYRSKAFGEYFGKPIVKFEEQPWKVGKYYVRDFVQGKFLYENGDLKKGFKYMEHGFHKATTQESYLGNNYIKDQIAEKGFVKYRQELFEFIDLLPTTREKNLNTWVAEATTNLNEKYSFDLPIDSKLGNKQIDSYFRNFDLPKDENENHIGTIHSVKGETYDAVLLFLNKASGCRTLYANIFNKHENQLTDEEKEEIRIVYVGLTRASKIMVVAVPIGCKDIWRNKLKLE